MLDIIQYSLYYPQGVHGAEISIQTSPLAGVGVATDSRQLLDSRAHSALVVVDSRVRPT